MIKNIQVLRAIAAYLVVLFHCIELIAGQGYGPGWTFGAAGVDIFFVISGYIMAYTTLGGVAPARFALNRIERIVPLYWIMTLATFAVALAAPSLMKSTTADFGDLARSLFFIPYMKDSGLVQPVLFVGWTLNLEMFFYAVFTASLFFGRRSVWIASAALVALVAAGAFAHDPIARFLTQPIMLEFVAGMLIARHRLILPKGAAWAAVAAGFALLIAHKIAYPDVPATAARLIPAAAIVLGAVSLESHGRVIRNRLALLLGDASYALYLTHPFVVLVFVKLFVGSAFPMRLLAFAGALAAAGVVGVAVHKLIEKPIAAVVKKHRLKRGAASAPAPGS
jgi:exopolysaccharide production protein ExoZ